MGRGKGKSLARRIQDPTTDVVDDSQYDVLRPGVMLSTGRDQTTKREYRTTSGVLVQDALGEKYMTIASHGFSHGDAVFHPSATGKQVAQIIMEVSSSDIAIAKLHHNVPFGKETFGSPLDGATPTRLTQFVSANETQIGSSIYMNNPFTGYSEGTCGPHVRMRVPIDDPNQPSLQWIKSRWIYLGQGFINHLQDGICGSAIWDDNGRVLGFFRMRQ